MSDIKRRLDRIEDTFFGFDSERYRNLCWQYNLITGKIRGSDLCEEALALLERRELDPEIEKRMYAPIPSDAPKHFVERAKREMLSEHAPPDYSDEDLKEMHEYLTKELKEAREAEKRWDETRANIDAHWKSKERARETAEVTE